MPKEAVGKSQKKKSTLGPTSMRRPFRHRQKSQAREKIEGGDIRSLSTCGGGRTGHPRTTLKGRGGGGKFKRLLTGGNGHFIRL